MELFHPPFRDRRDAGRQLGAALMPLKDAHPVVLGLPRGGVPVAYEIAQMLEAPLDVLLVRKIGAPGFPELGLGAVVDGEHPQRVMNQGVLDQIRPSQEYIEAEVRHQLGEIERRRKLYCGDRPPVPVQGRTVIVVDDGIATGGTMKTALTALAQAGVGRLLFAVPVAPPDVLPEMLELVDDAVCLWAPPNFRAVSLYYEDFAQTSDEEVIKLLRSGTAGPMPSGPWAPPPADDPRWFPSSPS